jgi:hypothetical protein
MRKRDGRLFTGVSINIWNRATYWHALVKNKHHLEYKGRSLHVRTLRTRTLMFIFWNAHRISIPAYAVEQQRRQSGVPKNEMSFMSFIFKTMLVLYQSVSISGSISNIYWHASKWSSISFSHWQCPSDREFSFPRFVGLLILVYGNAWLSSLLFYSVSGSANSMNSTKYDSESP